MIIMTFAKSKCNTKKSVERLYLTFTAIQNDEGQIDCQVHNSFGLLNNCVFYDFDLNRQALFMSRVLNQKLIELNQIDIK